MQTDVTVEAYSGYRYGERPRAFTWQGRRYEVLEVEYRWRTPRGTEFVVTATQRGGRTGPPSDDEGCPVERWELMYNEVQDTWHIRRADIKEDRCD